MTRFIQALLFSISCFSTAAPVLKVNRLDDHLTKPVPGMLRWALMQKGPRQIEFEVSGTIKLRGRIKVSSGQLTVDGSTAPGMGICIRGGSLEFSGVSDVTLRYLRVRRGDENLPRSGSRPAGSSGLDCLAFRDCQRVLVEHCSLSWSCDELIAVIHCKEVRVRDCLLSEPLGDPSLHPYGDRHAFALLASASTLTVERCLFAHYIMRGPQFEANDMRRKDNYTVRMTARDNVMFDYSHSGSRWTAGVEDHKPEAKGKHFVFTIKDNIYIPGKAGVPAIQRVGKHGKHPGVSTVIENNTVLEKLDSLDQKPWLHAVGCSHWRDAVDARVMKDLMENRKRPMLKSQRKVGGWPELEPAGETIKLLFGTTAR
ncbi:MAG: hypothetical protein JNJ83_15220 [Verrucomicrobiaceae bacterium]|nr:hypothetical protein [Verrucomicrobiaceae bacterium]